MATRRSAIVVPLRGTVGDDQLAFARRTLLEAATTVDQAVIDMRAVQRIDLSEVDSLLDVADLLRRRGVEVTVQPGWARDALRLTGHPALVAGRALSG